MIDSCEDGYLSFGNHLSVPFVYFLCRAPFQAMDIIFSSGYLQPSHPLPLILNLINHSSLFFFIDSSI